jgi:hypothetical protein
MISNKQSFLSCHKNFQFIFCSLFDPQLNIKLHFVSFANPLSMHLSIVARKYLSNQTSNMFSLNADANTHSPVELV